MTQTCAGSSATEPSAGPKAPRPLSSSQWPKKVLATAEIEAGVEEAERFEPPPSHFIVATTAPRVVKAQRSTRELSDRRVPSSSRTFFVAGYRTAGHFTSYIG